MKRYISCNIAGINEEPIAVRTEAASNPSTRPATLERLYARGFCDERVKEALAGNPNIPDTILNELAVSNNFNVRLASALNPKAPEDALPFILETAGSHRLHAALERGKIPPKLHDTIIDKYNFETNYYGFVYVDNYISSDMCYDMADEINSEMSKHNFEVHSGCSIEHDSDRDDELEYVIWMRCRYLFPDDIELIDSIVDSVLQRNIGVSLYSSDLCDE